MGKVLVSGGLGFIGSHTVVELIQQNFEVLIVDNLSNSSLEVLDGIELITGVRPDSKILDLTNFENVKDIFNDYTISSIIHFAAYKAVGESVEKPLDYYSNNLNSLLNLLKLSRQYKVENFIFSSSCTVYGQPKILPVTEETPIQKAMSPYGNTKQIGEEIIQDFVASGSNTKAISLRYFNPIGAHESAMIGELPTGVPNNLVPYITQTAIGKHECLKVFGDDYNTLDGTCVRDYIHVVDLAEAHVRALDYCGKMEENYEVFNVGTGSGTSVFEIIRSFEKISNKRLNYEIVERRSGDVEKIFANTDKANQVLGWKSKRNLDDMMRSAWNWEKNLSKKVHNDIQ